MSKMNTEKDLKDLAKRNRNKINYTPNICPCASVIAKCLDIDTDEFVVVGTNVLTEGDNKWYFKDRGYVVKVPPKPKFIDHNECRDMDFYLITKEQILERDNYAT